MRVAIIGGGAAGFFSAISVKENFPNSEVFIFEKSKHFLAKVKISGGGRCNITNGCSTISELCKAYPRGGNKLKRNFHIFGTMEARNWFEKRGVPLVLQEDGCVFPESQNSQSVIDCFLNECKRLGVITYTERSVKEISKENSKLVIHFENEMLDSELFDKVIVCIGGASNRKRLNWLENLGHKIEEPVPSLFTLNMPNEAICKLMGLVVENVQISVVGTKFKSEGALLITHWGMSGPAVLKISSYAARYAAEKLYHFSVSVNWIKETNNELLANNLHEIFENSANKQISNVRPYSLPSRLWLYLLEKCEISPEKKCKELSKKEFNKLLNILSNNEYKVQGKSTFREEFVTCGGISLDSINLQTMQSKICENLYFAGEVLDIDAITGGYNLQNAWTTAFIAAKLI